MIRVYRPNEPPGFRQQRTRWEKELQEAIYDPHPMSMTQLWRKIRQRKAMQVFAEVLFTVFHHKCAFCESKTEHVSPLHIEHYRPKNTSAFLVYMFDWHNWLVACMACNSNKGERFDICDDRPCLLDPTTEDPSEHIDFLAAQIIPKTHRGKKTIEQIRLHRIDLTKARALWLLDIDKLLLLAIHVPAARATARELLIWAMQDDAPYAAMARSYLRQRAPKLADPAIPHPVVQLDEPARKLNEILNRYQTELQEFE
ncbi:MAG: hypothetical protein R3C14_36110 [Caldilineaceae bacterium]